MDDPRHIEYRNINTGGGDYAEGDLYKQQVIIAPPPPPTPEAIAAALAHFAELPTAPDHPIPAPTTLPKASRLLGQRNSHFVGREQDLRTLARLIAGDGGATHIGQSVATTGLGGIGKSNLATEFAYRYGQFFHGGVFMLSFAEEASVTQEVVACSERMGLYPAGVEMTSDERVERVIAAWQQPMPRLLIFDNCEDERLFQAWYQRISGSGCRVLLTARRGLWSKALGVQTHALGVLTRAESIALLAKHRPNLATHPAINAIAEELGDLPLALHLAGSYLETFADDDQFGDPDVFLGELRDAKLLDHDALKGIDTAPNPTNHELHVGKTFALSMDRLNAEREPDATALRLLGRAAHFAAGAWIGRELLIATLGMAEDNTAGAKTASRSLNLLVGLGLLDRDEAQGLRIHRLLAAFVQQQIADASAAGDVERVLQRALRAANDTGDPRNYTPLWPHLNHLLDQIQNRGDVGLAALLNNTGYAYKLQGDYPQALLRTQRALAIYEQVLGRSDLDTATCLNNLASVYRAQGLYTLALPLYQRTLAIREQLCGPYHRDTAMSLNNVAALYDDLGVYTQALPLYQRVLAIKEQTLEPSDLSLATSLNNLAECYRNQGQYTAALPLYQRVLSIHEQVLEPTHPRTAGILNNLAILYQAQGAYELALPLYQRALAIREQVLGPTHPDTATSLNTLAGLYNDQGQYELALSLYQRALAIREQVLGPTHPDTATSLNNLAVWYAYRGQWSVAVPLMERVVAISEQALGIQHPDTQSSRQSLANMRQNARIASLPETIRAAITRNNGPALQFALNTLSQTEQQQVFTVLIETGIIQTQHPRDSREALAPLLRDIAQVALGDAAPQAQVEQALVQLEAQGFMLREPVERIWQGERDAASLCAGLDATDTALIEWVLELIAEGE